MKWQLRFLASSVTAAAFVVSGMRYADALPKEGERAPNARVEDVDGRPVDVKSMRGKTVVLFYEGKDTAHQNHALKQELARLRKSGSDAFKSGMLMVAVGDVSDYDYWPVKGIVKDKIREEIKKSGWPIYCDWDGSFRGTYKLRQNASNLVVIGKDGSVLFSTAGSVNAASRQRLIKVLRADVEGG